MPVITHGPQAGISDSNTKAGQRSGALRTARWRLRRQRGYRVYQIEVSAADIKALIARGLLDRQCRDDPNAVERGIGLLLDGLGR
jgi:hypothetical protein